MMPDLRHRSYQAELIDDLSLSSEALAQNLRELAFINKWLGGNAITTGALGRLLAQTPSRPHVLRIADVGCGGGDMLQTMARWGRRRGVQAEWVGIDANAFMVDYARKHSTGYPEIVYLQENILQESFRKQQFDISTMTLFCHHFKEDTLVEFFATLRQQTRIALVINDLHRHWLAYHSIAWLTALFSKSYLVKNDAKLSVWRGFQRHELRDLLVAAGFGRVEIRWRWAFRWEVIAWID
jgi:2-polyprenyl-3-methyl-5-hydroxy-6-metoxy-1,4-benzoquinol methylase